MLWVKNEFGSCERVQLNSRLFFEGIQVFPVVIVEIVGLELFLFFDSLNFDRHLLEGRH